MSEGSAAKSWVIGGGGDCDIVVDRPTVSARHCRLTCTPEGFFLEDLRSTNGTFVNDLRIDGRVPVSPTDRITLGLTVAMPWPEVVQSRGRAAAGFPEPARTVLTESTIVGRDANCDLVLDDPIVSRRHARLICLGTRITVEDLHSTNGTFVNGSRIEQPTPIARGDVLAIGRTTFRLTDDGSLEQRSYRGHVTIDVRGVTVDAGDRRLLEDISLTVYPSEFVALMGPSGAGKTTLISALNGYTPPTSGTVLFNGQDLYANYHQFRGSLGYVPQDDIIHPDLTVAQALYYTARLRLPSDTTDAEIAQRVAGVIAQLGLEGTENVLIGSPQKKGISGGQRKRVNLGMELLTDPSVLFLDEPTSGLSSEDALNVMRLLRRLADGGKTILLTIHQPSLEAYRLLDNLILVAKDSGSAAPGRLAYYGPAYPQAIEFFNPETAGRTPGVELSPDDVLRGLAKEKAEEWVKRYQASPLKRQYVDHRAAVQPVEPAQLPAARSRRSLGIRQWSTLVRRCLAIKWKDTSNTAILMVQAPIIALLVVLVFGKHASAEVTPESWPSVAGAVSTAVFLLALAALWFGCSNAAREIVGEWPIYHRERMVNLKIPSYIGSKFFVLGGLCLMQCAVLLGIVHWGAGLEGPWMAMFGMLLLTSLVGLAIGLSVSALARTSEVAIALLPLILLPMVILAGVLQPLHKMNALGAGLAQVMPSRWAFEGLLLLETEDRPSWTPPSPPALLSAGEGKRPVPLESKAHDMAERFFPAETDRTSVGVAGLALGAMLVLIVAGIHAVLRARDLH